LKEKLDSTQAVVWAVFCFYVLFTAIALGLHGGNPLWFAWLGERYMDLEPAGRLGYDGQFVYYIARDGLAAVPHLDNPPYRLQRILLPLLTRGLALGQPQAIPWVVISINLVAIVAATYALAQWLNSSDLSPWYALTFALFVGVFMAYSRDLTEPLAYGLAAWAIVSWMQRKRTAAMVLLALSALTKETAMLFAISLALAQLANRNLRRAMGCLLSLIPLALWEGYLYMRFGVVPLQSGTTLGFIPLGGILPHLTVEPGRVSAFVFVGIPALAAILSAAALFRNPRSEVAWLVLAQGAFVILMPANVYDHLMHAGRNAAGLVLAVVFALPGLGGLVRKAILVCCVTPTLIWLLPVLRWAPWLSKI